MYYTYYTQLLLAQTEAEPMAGGAWDNFSMVYLFAGSMVFAGFAFGAQKLIEYINVKTKNELMRGIFGRLIGSVRDAVGMVNQTIKKELLAAKDPDSPGGMRMTQSEKARLLEAAIDALKLEYGGWDGMFRLLKKIGLGEEGAKAKIKTMVESAVNDAKNVSRPQ